MWSGHAAERRGYRPVRSADGAALAQRRHLGGVVARTRQYRISLLSKQRGAARHTTRLVRSKSITCAPAWLNPSVCQVMMPWTGRQPESRTFVTVLRAVERRYTTGHGRGGAAVLRDEGFNFTGGGFSAVLEAS